jgi:hypothetical protein
VSQDEADQVERDSIIADVLESRPDAARVLYEEFHLPCVSCEVAFSETLAEGVSYTGLDPEVVIARLNQCPLEGRPRRPPATSTPQTLDP